MARLAEVSRSPTEPLSDGAAESTFELYVISSMLGAILDTCTHTDRSTFTTHQFLRLVVLPFHLTLLAVLHTSEVGTLALEALVVRQFVNRERTQIVEEPIISVKDSRVFVQTFVFCSLDSFIKQIFLHFQDVFHFINKDFAMGSFNPLLARRTFEEIKDYSRTWPSFLDLAQDTIKMENVFAF